MVKLIGDANQINPIVSARQVAQTAKDNENNKPSAPILIVDRVTLSSRGRALSRKYAPSLVNNSGPVILSYEIRKPFTAPKTIKSVPSLPFQPKGVDKK